MSKKILIVAGHSISLIKFRGELLKKIISKFHKVMGVAPPDKQSEETKKKLKKIGAKFKTFNLVKAGLNPFEDFNSYRELSKIFKSYNPDIILAYTAKAVIYAGIAARNYPNTSFYPMITGVGYGFTNVNSIKKKFVNIIMKILYYKSLKNASAIIFQNHHDKKLFINNKIIYKKKKIYVVSGSGVDLKIYPKFPLPKKPIFLMVSRLLIDKGVIEYFEAAKIVRRKFPDAVFKFVGDLDTNPTSINSSKLKMLINQGDVNYHKHSDKVQNYLKICKFFVLPSYREGTPRSTLEALASGRPIITTNAPGCRETVKHKKNGLLVPIKNSKALANAMISLLNKKNSELKIMAYESFKLAKKKYDVKKVNKEIMKIINL